MTIDSTNFHFPDQIGEAYHGKVRDVYTIRVQHVEETDFLLMVATDRISAFDVILPRSIPFKGQVLNQIAVHFLERTAHIAPNWLVSVLDPNVSFGNKCEPFKIEMVIRGLLVGHAWREYQAGKRELCGVKLPEGMQEYDAFPEPIITPSTKADEGHDEDISSEQIIETGLASKEQWEQLCDLTRKLFACGQEMAAARGLVLADTKYEFGMFRGKIHVIDEIHTPDSSRYFYKDSYDAFVADRTKDTPKHLSKEFVRQWLLDNNFSGQEGQKIPDMTDEVVRSISKRYIELYEQIIGKPFEPADATDPYKRIEENVRLSNVRRK